MAEQTSVVLRSGERVRLVWQDGDWRITKFLPGRPGLQGVVLSRSHRWWRVERCYSIAGRRPDWYPLGGANTLKGARQLLARCREERAG